MLAHPAISNSISFPPEVIQIIKYKFRASILSLSNHHDDGNKFAYSTMKNNFARFARAFFFCFVLFFAFLYFSHAVVLVQSTA